MRRRPNYAYLVKEKARGKTFWYVRIDKGPRYRLRAEPGTPEFRRCYEEAVAKAERGLPPSEPSRQGPSAGTLNWLWAVYTGASAWSSLSASTRRQRENIMKHVLANVGHARLDQLTKKVVMAGLERRAMTPSAANNYLNTMRHLFAWARKNDHVTVDPTLDIEHVQRPTTGGFPEWSEEDEAKFIARWPKGTRQYLAYMVHACTGLRRSDAVRLGRQHFGKDGKIHLTAEKNKAELNIPVHQDLVDAIEACPPTALHILETTKGKPWVKESYGNEFHDWTVAAGVVEAGKPKNSHGIRKLAATRVCNAGASPHEMMALFGWKTVAMAEVYTKKRDQQRLAAQAGAKVGAVGALVPFFIRGE